MPTPTDLTGNGTWDASPTGTGAPPGYWNAKQGPPAFVRILFSPHPVTVTEVNATVQQTPDGDTKHQVLVTLEDNREIEIDLWDGRTVTGQVLITNLLVPVTNVKSLRINTIVSPSWVSWQNVQVSGYASASIQTSEIGSTST
jgi:hypothetical protein